MYLIITTSRLLVGTVKIGGKAMRLLVQNRIAQRSIEDRVELVCILLLHAATIQLDRVRFWHILTLLSLYSIFSISSLVSVYIYNEALLSCCVIVIVIVIVVIHAYHRKKVRSLAVPFGFAAASVLVDLVDFFVIFLSSDC